MWQLIGCNTRHARHSNSPVACGRAQTLCGCANGVPTSHCCCPRKQIYAEADKAKSAWPKPTVEALDGRKRAPMDGFTACWRGQTGLSEVPKVGLSKQFR